MKKVLIAITTSILILCYSPHSSSNVLSLNPLDNEAVVLTAGSIAAASLLYVYYIKHPDKLSNFISNQPKKAVLLLAYVEWRINTTKNDKKREDFINFRDTLDLGYNEWRSQEIEKDPDWIRIKNEIALDFEKENKILEQKKDFSLCSKKSLEVLLQKKKDFNDYVNTNLPRIYSNPTKVLSVNSYYFLGEKYDAQGIQMEQDHIPSFAAIETFLKNNGLTTKTITKLNPKGKSYKVRDKDLEGNESAIAIPYVLHKDASRTFAGRNTSKKINDDAKNLELATEKDVATIAYFLYKNPNYGIYYQDYIESAIVLYSRNKLLCLYDVN